MRLENCIQTGLVSPIASQSYSASSVALLAVVAALEQNNSILSFVLLPTAFSISFSVLWIILLYPFLGAAPLLPMMRRANCIQIELVSPIEQNSSILFFVLLPTSFSISFSAIRIILLYLFLSAAPLVPMYFASLPLLVSFVAMSLMKLAQSCLPSSVPLLVALILVALPFPAAVVGFVSFW